MVEQRQNTVKNNTNMNEHIEKFHEICKFLREIRCTFYHGVADQPVDSGGWQQVHRRRHRQVLGYQCSCWGEASGVQSVWIKFHQV